MTFQHPWLLSLCIPAFIWLWHSHPDRSAVFYLRVVSLFLMLLGLSNPTTLFQVNGQDFIVVVDQSDSMPLTQLAFAEETIQDLESRLNDGDRLGIISVGAEVRIDKQLVQNGRQLYPIQKTDASKLSTALDTALKQIPPERKGQIILLSDGGNTERPWLAEVRTAIVRQIPIHTIAATQQSSQDIHIVSMDAPSEVSKGEGVQIEATVHSPFDGDVTVASASRKTGCQRFKASSAGQQSHYFSRFT